MAIVAVAMVTTLILPGRKTPEVIGAFGNAFGGVLQKAQGR